VVADHWVPYRSFRFDDGRAVIRAVDERQVIDTAAYLTENPSLRFGIDDSVDPAVTNAGDRDLGKRRVAAVRDALIEAGTPAYRIEMGAFADPQHRRYRQVELFLITVR
jgi:outer membrane protein OmpA-like peptidoglycan-associated protein